MAKLPIMPVVSAAFRRVAGSPQQAIKVGLPYFGLLAVLGVIEALVAPSDPTAMGAGGGILTLGLLVLQIVIYTWMAIAWHRVTLVGFSTDQGAFRMQFGPREWRFLGYSLLIYPLVIMVVLTIAVLAFVSGALATLGGIVLTFMAVFLILRCALVLPATAIDHPTSLKTSWQQTDGSRHRHSDRRAQRAARPAPVGRGLHRRAADLPDPGAGADRGDLRADLGAVLHLPLPQRPSRPALGHALKAGAAGGEWCLSGARRAAAAAGRRRRPRRR
mgnify:CR=1 FL=1